jgi:hypothetical protein
MNKNDSASETKQNGNEQASKREGGGRRLSLFCNLDILRPAGYLIHSSFRVVFVSLRSLRCLRQALRLVVVSSNDGRAEKWEGERARGERKLLLVDGLEAKGETEKADGKGTGNFNWKSC